VKHEGKKKVRFFCFVFLVFLFLCAVYSSIPSVFFFFLGLILFPKKKKSGGSPAGDP
jgi:uncharacterized protein YqgC (DUF456 family)